jgi:hypothetical protein
MSGRRVAVLCAAVALAVAAPALLPAQQADMSLSNPTVFGRANRGPVRFTHRYHMALDGGNCLVCHHRFEDGRNVLDVKEIREGDPSLRCARCHEKPRELQRVFHLQCITCHETSSRGSAVKPPRSCGECHAAGR